MEIKLEIKISEDKKIKLTEKEAKELYGKLNEMFGGKLAYEPFTFPNYPIDYVKYTE